MTEQGGTDRENDTADQRRDEPGIGGKMEGLLSVGRNVQQNVERAVRDDRGAEREYHRQRMLAQKFADPHPLGLPGFQELRRFGQPRTNIDRKSVVEGKSVDLG